MNNPERGVSVEQDRVVFGNLVAVSATVIGAKDVITVQRPDSAVVERSNAKGSLRSVAGVSDVAALGAEAAQDVLSVLKK